MCECSYLKTSVLESNHNSLASLHFPHGLGHVPFRLLVLLRRCRCGRCRRLSRSKMDSCEKAPRLLVAAAFAAAAASED